MKPENKLKELERKLHIYQQDLANLREQLAGPSTHAGTAPEDGAGGEVPEVLRRTAGSVAKQAGEAWTRDNKLDRLMAEGYHLRQSMVGAKKWVIEDTRDIMGGYTIRGYDKDELIDEAYQHLIVDTQEPDPLELPSAALCPDGYVISNPKPGVWVWFNEMLEEPSVIQYDSYELAAIGAWRYAYKRMRDRYVKAKAECNQARMDAAK